jgi:tetratricopeptide (TPR) repeat protein
MKLSGAQRKELHKALSHAFPERPVLAQMVRYGLDVALSDITEAGSLNIAVYELIEWADRRGRLDELIRAALDANPTNPELRTTASVLLHSVDINELHLPLYTPRKNLREVELARLKVYELLSRGNSLDPTVKQQLEVIYQQLDALRDDIFRASEGACSNERAAHFEKAIEIYTKALNLGYDVIVDDTTGEYTDVRSALERARRSYMGDLKRRAHRRYNEALNALIDGYPQAAIKRLEEAQELVSKIEEGGEEVRGLIDQALAKAHQQL